MITAYLQGGLGNQMFQIAAAHALSLRLGIESKFNFNASHVETQGHSANKYKDNIFKNVNNEDLNFNGFRVYQELGFKYDELPLLDNLCLLGVFHSEKYFLDYKNDIIKLFNFGENKKIKEFITNNIGDTSVTGIHVRRGDYLNKTNFHPTCDLEYYTNAMGIINDKKYLVFSDDLNWCKENFIGEQFIFSPFTSEIDDLHLLINCNNHIIANSSFSWWGAYLCENENKVIAPKNWFGPHGPQDTQDVYINNWIKI